MCLFRIFSSKKTICRTLGTRTSRTANSMNIILRLCWIIKINYNSYIFDILIYTNKLISPSPNHGDMDKKNHPHFPLLLLSY